MFLHTFKHNDLTYFFKFQFVVNFSPQQVNTIICEYFVLPDFNTQSSQHDFIEAVRKRNCKYGRPRTDWKNSLVPLVNFVYF